VGKNGDVLNTSHGSHKEVTVICWHLELWCGVLDALFDAGLILGTVSKHVKTKQILVGGLEDFFSIYWE
jgi:hypothetical protein